VGGTTMFTVQTDYWNDMMEKIQETYKTSLTSGQEYQEEFTGFIRDMFKNNHETVVQLQNETRKNVNRMISLSLENIDQFSKVYSDNCEYGTKALQSILEKYNVNNDDLRREVENLWKENINTFHRKVSELTEMINNTQQKNMDMMMDVFHGSIEKEVQNIRKRTEDIREKVTNPEEKTAKTTKTKKS
jgi:hypothetical protein